ncbi:hypothetical protein JAAARDRAFT_127533, partial [Jaapia argillacea MUCL 33604]
DPDPRKQMEDTRHLAKYVFPRQFGLSSPFSFDGQQKTQSYQLPDFGDREEEIKKRGPCKTPKRVKTALELLEKLIWRHGKCGYKPLRDKACPSRVCLCSSASYYLSTTSGFVHLPAEISGFDSN